MFPMDLIKLSLANVMFFPQAVTAKRTIYFRFVPYVFLHYFFIVSGSVEIIEAKKFVMFGDWWRVEAGSDRATNNLY